MTKHLTALLLVLTLSLCGTAALSESSAPAKKAEALPTIKYEKYKLKNGLEVILSEDHRLPLVAVDLWYHVGPSNEREGRTGFAHLFEHMMFEGSKHIGSKAHFRYLEGAGATGINGTTNFDRTNYFETVPSNQLDLALWLESDRMGYLLDTLDGEKLANQRDVVRNERRQSIENRPYGVEELTLPRLLWPESHPYHHPVIGSHEDLEAASVPDVKDFFATWYDPSNASLVVAGDFDPAQATAMIEQKFSSTPTRAKPVDPGAPGFSDEKTTLTSVVRETVPDNVELTKITMAWQSPRHFGPGDAELDLLAGVLAQGKASRLYKSLVYDQKIAQEVSARQESRFLGSDFVIDALVRPGVDPAKVEKAIFAELARVRDKEVSAEELDRARATYEMAFVDRLQGIAERASILNDYQAETGDPGYVQKDLDRYRHATTKDVLGYAKKVLDPNAMVILTIVPKKEAKR